MVYDRRPAGDQESRRVSGRVLLAAGLVAVVIGNVVLFRGLSGGAAYSPASAQEIPATVGTAAPHPVDRSAVASPLPPSVPVGIKIPALGVQAPVMRLGLNSDRTVEVPPLANHNMAGWYDGSVTPGADGSAVILGHVDNYTGPSVFFRIKTLRAGDEIYVSRADGTVAAFAVDGVRKVAKAQFPANEIYGKVPYPSLRLITCGGPFDAATGEYVDNIVVYAHLDHR